MGLGSCNSMQQLYLIFLKLLEFSFCEDCIFGNSCNSIAVLSSFFFAGVCSLFLSGFFVDLFCLLIGNIGEKFYA